MIVKALRVWFCGILSCKDKFFSLMQGLGIVEFDKSYSDKKIDLDISNLSAISKKLYSFGVQPKKCRERDLLNIVDRVFSLNEVISDYETLLLKQSSLRAEFEKKRFFCSKKLLPLFNFCNTNNLKMQALSFASFLSEQVECIPGVFKVTEVDNTVFAISVDADISQISEMIKVEDFDEDFFSLEKNLLAITKKISLLESKIFKSGEDLSLIEEMIWLLRDQLNKSKAQNSCEDLYNSIFVVKGWCSSKNYGDLLKACNRLHVHVDVLDSDETEVTPTIFENSGLARAGQDLVQIYDTPSVDDIDPSLWVLVSFAIFFAMIVCDAGYGLLMTLSSLYFWSKSNKSLYENRPVLIAVIISISTLIVGILFGSFFAIDIAPDSILRTFSVLDFLSFKKLKFCLSNQNLVFNDLVSKFPDILKISDPKSVFLYQKDGSFVVASYFYDGVQKELSVSVGIIHLCIGMMRYSFRSYIMVFWMLLMVGCYFILVDYLAGVTFFTYAFGVSSQFLLYSAKIISVLSLSLINIIALFERGLWGIFELTNSIQIFADVLSYLRIYALALSGAMVASTCNELAIRAGLFFAIPVLILGHTINFFLSIMGGVVHGLRLNFLEWYHYCFYGGGRLFDPLKNSEKNKK